MNTEFLNELYNHNEITVYSSSEKYTIESAINFLNGLYPVKTGPNLPPYISDNLTFPSYNLSNYSVDFNGALPN